ncbi:MAG TPA: IS4 family transposase [Anaeromyxobacter sp.]|nr:IS4 family transposase [Anaeromyxobacter sp.]
MSFDVPVSQADRGLFKRFQASINPLWVEEALSATGTASLRRRRFPAEQVIWLVLGMALFRDLPITDVVKELALVLPGSGKRRIAPSAVAQARARLGPSPLRWLFDKCARVWALRSADRLRWRGLSVFGADGSTVRVPDGPENRKKFGGSGSGRGESGYPIVRLVTLMALRSHLLLGMWFGPGKSSERKHARELWPLVPEDSVVVVDRGFMYAKDLYPIQANGKNRHWLSRARKNNTWRTVKRLGPGDVLAEILVNSRSRREDPSLPERWSVRAIRYRRRGFREQTLLTSLLDPRKYPREEIVALYHERWELELGYDEVKTEMLQREEAIRSQTPAGVEQELWGIALAYNLVRLEMERAAAIAGVPPVRMSFVACYRAIKFQLLLFASISPGKMAKVLERFHHELAASCVLPPRRSERLYPRAVKIKMSNYPRKRPSTK